MAFMNQCVPSYNKIGCTKIPNETQDNEIVNSRKWTVGIRILDGGAAVISAF